MVEDTGKALRPGTYKPVNTPEELKVEEDAEGLPVTVKGKRRQAVISIEDRWRIDDEWWRAAPVSRLYYNVLLASGQRAVLYKDLISNKWYEQEY
ncbi:MAG: hypothetical protein JW845_02730 [Dehalococcoidales bacterium]|nr:hypothetical protein [Dehalococcoidales bacterium]